MDTKIFTFLDSNNLKDEMHFTASLFSRGIMIQNPMYESHVNCKCIRLILKCIPTLEAVDDETEKTAHISVLGSPFLERITALAAV